ncbi:MAG: hypothetical protein P1V21_08175 [Rhizobiaceae bacterium]|nr:hypothetical protein [Rhizobiaceae bacterium]
MPSVVSERHELVTTVMDRIIGIVASGAVEREGLDLIRLALLELTQRPDLFTAEHFHPPRDPKRNSNMFELYRSDGDGSTLYVSIAPAGLTTPVHYHTTWAVIAGLRGAEFNQFYTRDDAGRPVASNNFVVENGTAITMMPNDLHSIRIVETPDRFFSFHLYGLPLEQATERMFYVEDSDEWKYFAHRPNIRQFNLATGLADG